MAATSGQAGFLDAKERKDHKARGTIFCDLCVLLRLPTLWNRSAAPPVNKKPRR
jgi:hypothetical protein